MCQKYCHTAMLNLEAESNMKLLLALNPYHHCGLFSTPLYDYSFIAVSF